jgi:DNA-binding NtrC family response regulator
MTTPEPGAPIEAGSADPPTLLLVDDDPLVAETLAFVLRSDYTVVVAATRAETRAWLQVAAAAPALALVDLGLPPTPHSPEEGFALIGELLAFNPRMKILVLSGQSERRNIQHALTLGAVDFVPKPTDVPLLKARLAHQIMLVEAERLEAEKPSEACGLLGRSPAMQTLRAQIRQFADTPFPVLIEGESGSGKELVAHCLHSQSARARASFLTINCAAIASDLMEAQLFGHAKGSFTGALSARSGFFEEAGEGTLFLDEIGEFPLELQPKLLRVLENGEYYRVGETRPRRSFARVIAATNRDLRDEVRTGRFREDLYHRLGVLTIRVPPLRELGEDVFELLDHFRGVYAGPLAPFSLDEDGRRRLAVYAFPGNVRELRNVVIRLAAKYPGQRVSRAAVEGELDLDLVPTAPPATEALDERAEQQIRASGFRLDGVLTDWERRYINAALRLAQGNLSQAARLLGVNRTTLYSRIQRLDGTGGS